jgi:hypothetical protein
MTQTANTVNIGRSTRACPLCEHSVLGPIDPQLGDSPAASLIKVSEEKPVAKIDDRTLVLVDVGRKAIAQVKQAASELMTRRLPAEQATCTRRKTHVGHVDARLSDMGLDREVAWPDNQHRYAGRCFSTAEALSATRSHAERWRRGISAGAAAATRGAPLNLRESDRIVVLIYYNPRRSRIRP